MATSTTGSILLLPLSDAVQLPIDQVNFVACQLFALLAAILFRTYLHSSKTSPLIRHVVATLLGLYLALFCFGWYALHFIVQSGISYVIMIAVGVEHMHKYCFVFALGYLTLCQIARVYIFDYGQYSADFSGPMMIITQKITSLAFEIRDGIFCKEETLTPSQRRLAVRRRKSSSTSLIKPSCLQVNPHTSKDSISMNPFFRQSQNTHSQRQVLLTICYNNFPVYTIFLLAPGHIGACIGNVLCGMLNRSPRMPSLLEYLSYCCNFMGILAGPLCCYKDYITFIEGRSYHVKEAEMNGKEDLKYEHKEPSPNTVVIHKLVVCAISLAFYMTATRILPVEYNIDERFQETSSVPTRVIYLYLSLMAARPKYYFAWTLADTINNAAGFGFQGYDKHGNENWDLVSNLKIKNIEFSTSFKMFIDNWNIQTALWLKRVCYERATNSPTAQTFLLSAIWHGVYPGYYLTFFTGSLMTLAARNIRNNVRHHFLKSPELKLIYDVMTWIATQVAISYTVAPFVLLSVKPSLQFFSAWYYCLHITCILVLLTMPARARKKGRTEKESIDPPLEKMNREETHCENNSHAATNNNSHQREETAWRRLTAAQ